MTGSDKSERDHTAGELAAPIVQITLSSAKLFLWISETDCPHALWNNPPQSFHVCYVHKNVHTLLIMNFHDFYRFWVYLVLLLAFHTFFEPDRCFTFKMDSSVHDCSTGLKQKAMWCASKRTLLKLLQGIAVTPPNPAVVPPLDPTVGTFF